jgi:hypothetical protein
LTFQEIYYFLIEKRGCFTGVLCGGRMSGVCNDDIGAEEVKAVLADDTGVFPHKIFIKTRYSVCTT